MRTVRDESMIQSTFMKMAIVDVFEVLRTVSCNISLQLQTSARDGVLGFEGRLKHGTVSVFVIFFYPIPQICTVFQ